MKNTTPIPNTEGTDEQGSATRLGLRQPAAAFLSQPAGAESIAIPKHGDNVSAERLASSSLNVVCHSALRATPAGWRGESGSRLPHSTALRATKRSLHHFLTGLPTKVADYFAPRAAALALRNTLAPALLAILAALTPAHAQEVATPTAPASIPLAPYRFAGYVTGQFIANYGANKSERGSGVIASHPRVALSAAHVVFDTDFGFYPLQGDENYPWATFVNWYGTNPNGTNPQGAVTPKSLDIVHKEDYTQLKKFRDAAKFEHELKAKGGDKDAAEAGLHQSYSDAVKRTAALDIIGLVAGSSLLSSGDFPVIASNSDVFAATSRKLLLGFPGHLNDLDTNPLLYSMHQVGPSYRQFTSTGVGVSGNADGAIIPAPSIEVWRGNSGGPWFVETATGEWKVGAIVGRGSGQSAPLSAKNSTAILKASIARAGGPANNNLPGDASTTPLSPGQTITGAVIGETIGDVDGFKLTIATEGDYTIGITSSTEILTSLGQSPSRPLYFGQGSVAAGYQIKAHLLSGKYYIVLRGATPSAHGTYSISCSAYNPTAPGIPDLVLFVEPSFTNPLPTENAIGGATTYTKSVKFGVHKSGSTDSVRQFAINNEGTASLSLPGVTPLTITGRHASSFRVLSQPPGTLAPDGRFFFHVLFIARYNAVHTAELNIASSDPSKPKIVVPLVGVGKGFSGNDDHANNTVSAVSGGNSVTDAATNPSGVIDYAGDSDFYRLVVPSYASYRIYTTGPTDTTGTLYKLTGTRAKKVDSAKFGPNDGNFMLQTVLDSGTYYIEVRGELKKSTTGDYQLHVEISATTGLLVVEGPGKTLIQDGDTTTSLENGTDFGSVFSGGRITKTFKLLNYGTRLVRLTGTNNVSISGSSAFSITRQPLFFSNLINAGKPSPGESDTFTITYTPSSSTPVSATVDIPATLAGLAGSSFRFAVKGGAGQVPLDASITDIASTPTTGTAGSQVQLAYAITSNQATDVLIGASLLAGNGATYAIGTGFPTSIAAGPSTYTITGNVAANTPNGTYQIRGALWRDNNSSGIIDTGDTVIGSPVNFGSYTVGSSVVPTGFVTIPGGTYQMGDSLGDGSSDETLHSVTLSTFYLQNKGTTKAEWDAVYTWAVANGYTFTNAGQGKATTHPVHTVDWYDVAKWCNARSEKEGLAPCYYTDAGQTVVYRTGSVDVSNTMVKWSANGYRLPTEAEREVASRGGLVGKRFPWGDTNTITHSLANYYVYSSNGTTNDYTYDTSPTKYFHPTYNDNVFPYTSPVGSFAANDYGLYDMAGNVYEWCWDWYGTYATGTDPHGVPSGSNRVIRGGSWYDGADYARCASRYYYGPANAYDNVGFRLARGVL